MADPIAIATGPSSNSPRDGIRSSLILSVVTGVCLAVYSWMMLQNMMMALLFGLLAFSSYQILQAYSGRGGGFGGGPW